ncbi:ABC transporter ATP-binding protein [Celeribacter ethanolicus]|uniref:ABC transporter ATP-binding protein n=1 Tax=Celeribacter ethanolicus TaxID=1758178 RepID=UPI0009D6ED5D|nr:ATP-binding cassette domain-containing protein [Celeribacter ethanolicus]
MRHDLSILSDGSEAAFPVKAALLHLDLRSVSAGGAQILGPVKLDIRAGETVALTGPSGVGKTTLLRVISGLHRDYEGEITRPPRLSAVFQSPTLLPWRKAWQNLTLTTGISKAEALDWLAAVGLSDHADQFPEQMSLGQQRRLALARAFAAMPDLLLMDEAFVSLDATLADEMMQLFETLRAQHGTTTLLVTHDRTEAARLADRVLCLDGCPATLRATA